MLLFLEELVARQKEIDWKRVEAFHPHLPVDYVQLVGHRMARGLYVLPVYFLINPFSSRGVGRLEVFIV